MQGQYHYYIILNRIRISASVYYLNETVCVSVVIDLQLRSVDCVLCLVFYMVWGLKMRSAPRGLQFNLANSICLRC